MVRCKLLGSMLFVAVSAGIPCLGEARQLNRYCVNNDPHQPQTPYLLSFDPERMEVGFLPTGRGMMSKGDSGPEEIDIKFFSDGFRLQLTYKYINGRHAGEIAESLDLELRVNSLLTEDYHDNLDRSSTHNVYTCS